jgi:tetratricopeptide (TPR) repeat protein
MSRDDRVLPDKSESTKAFKSFHRALELDANYLDAHLGWTIASRNVGPGSSRGLAGRAQSLARSFAYRRHVFRSALLVSHHQTAVRFDWDGASADLEHLMRMRPDDHQAWAHFLRSLGRFDEARGPATGGRRKYPDHVAVRMHACTSRLVERRYGEAIQEGRKFVEMYPENPMSYGIARAAIERGLPTGRRHDQENASHDDDPDFLALLARTYARMGDRAKAVEILQQLESPSIVRYVQAYSVARACRSGRQTEGFGLSGEGLRRPK